MKKLMTINESLTFPLADVEDGVKRYFEDIKEKRSDGQVCAEAKKIVQLLAGFRRIIRLNYELDQSLINFMELDAEKSGDATVHPFFGKFMGGDLESDADSLVSAPEEEETSVGRRQPGRKAAPPLAIKDKDRAGPGRGKARPAEQKTTKDDDAGDDEDADEEEDDEEEDGEGDESETTSEKDNSWPEFVIKKNWAVRFEDENPADNVTKAKDGKAVFHWTDGDIYYSDEVLYNEAIASKYKVETIDAKHQAMIEEARAACEQHGSFRVGINVRPKLSNGGWEVYIKSDGGKTQVWSHGSSHSQPVADSLMGVVLHANKLAKKKTRPKPRRLMTRARRVARRMARRTKVRARARGQSARRPRRSPRRRPRRSPRTSPNRRRRRRRKRSARSSLGKDRPSKTKRLIRWRLLRARKRRRRRRRPRHPTRDRAGLSSVNTLSHYGTLGAQHLALGRCHFIYDSRTYI